MWVCCMEPYGGDGKCKYTWVHIHARLCTARGTEPSLEPCHSSRVTRAVSLEPCHYAGRVARKAVSSATAGA